MKKIKLLSCAVMAAFMAFGLTSCEKENFNTDTDITVTPPTINIPGIEIPEGYKPGDAVVSIQPKVNALINGTITNVTEKATIKINGQEKKYEVITGQVIAAQEIAIVVSYTAVVDGFEKELTATDYVSVPALQAGMVAVITPTIWLSATTEGYFASKVKEEVSDVIKKNFVVTNEKDVWYSDYDAELVYVKEGSYLKSKEVMAGYENDKEVAEILNTYTEAFTTEIAYGTLTLEDLTVYAKSLTIIPYSQTLVTTEYEINKSMTWSRSTDVKTVAKFTIEGYGALELGKIKDNINLEGEGHGYGHGHGHGHSHGGNDNAGGSIVDAL